MKHYMTFTILLFSSLAFAADQQASCVINEENVLGRSSSGVAQVSNLGLIEITCRGPGRPWPLDPKSGFGRSALRVKTLAYQIGDEGRKTAVPSFSNVTGGRGCGPPPGECKEESVFLFLNIPIAPAEAITEFREFTKKLEAERPQSPEERQRVEERIRDLESHPDELAETVKQYRPGHFEVECRIMDGNRPWAVGHVELEILFKGRAFDALLGKPQQGR